MNKQIILLGIFFIFSLLKVEAQEALTAEEAVKIALENNYEIRLARNFLEIDEISVSPGLAGMLPQVSAVLQSSNGISSLTQVRSDGEVNSLNNALNNSLDYGVVLDWTVFDGFQMFSRYKQLKEIANLGEAELQASVLTTVSNVLITYYDLVQQQQQLSVLDSTLTISQERLELSHNRYSIGKASKLEELNARVDLNTDQALMLSQKETYLNTMIRLNELLARDNKMKFRVADEIAIDEELFLPKLETQLKENNPELLTEIINKRIAELELKRVKANRYPVIIASTGYNFNESESSLGFTTSSSSNGFTYGFGVSLNLFDGFNQNRNEQIAKIGVDNSKLVINQQQNDLITQLNSSYTTYQTSLQLIELEEKNKAIARENLEITMEKYRIGTIPTIEFRTAQLNYLNARLRYSNAVFQAKLSEISLKALSGKLPL